LQRSRGQVPPRLNPMTAEKLLDRPRPVRRPSGVADWRRHLDRERLSPLIAVAGSRGKTSVVRALESVLSGAGCRIASWTGGGVEIDGERQRGELGPWSRALTSLAAGGLDLAIQELDWVTVQTLAVASVRYPIVAVTNLCANSEACLITPEMVQARIALSRIRESVAPGGRLILNADDFVVSDDDPDELAHRYLIGINPGTPVLRRHLRRGGNACWIEDFTILIQEDNQIARVVDLRNLAWTRAGTIPFAVQNALLVTAIARACGVPPWQIADGLASHAPRPEKMPGSFNVFEADASTIIVDRPAPPWFLRTSLRATAAFASGRHLRVVGPMVNVEREDMFEVGRLLGRAGGVLVVHGAWTAERLELLRQGAAVNDVPPLFVQASDEHSAIHQAIGMLRPDDVLLVLAEDPVAVVRQITRRLRRRVSSRVS
jgi:cyanophycin synthetase